jgi:hypothetical protein
MRRMVWVVLGFGWMACGGGASPVCELAEQSSGCPECYSGEVTCTYDGVSETAGSCGDCQARAALYQALCDAGVEDAAETIEDQTECSEPVE